MPLTYRKAEVSDVKRCMQIRGMTRENPMSEQALAEYGVTVDSWLNLTETSAITGFVGVDNNQTVGFCFADNSSAEILVLALLPEYENRGVGKMLLNLTMQHLFRIGYRRLWLAASPDPHTRAHGFYRHIGWSPTGEIDNQGDQILEYSR